MMMMISSRSYVGTNSFGQKCLNTLQSHGPPVTVVPILTTPYKDSRSCLCTTSNTSVVNIMSSTRVFLCDLCVILLFGLTFVLAEDKFKSSNAPLEGPKGNCSCGGFPTSTPDVASSPILSQSPGLVVECDQDGENTCMSLCTALATATKAKGPEILCNRLKDADELKLSAFYKTCDKPWTYANMTAEQPLCCENSKVKTCVSAIQLNATSAVIDAKTIM